MGFGRQIAQCGGGGAEAQLDGVGQGPASAQ